MSGSAAMLAREEARVAAARRQARDDPEGGSRALAEALFDLSLALERAERPGDGFAAAREGVQVLSPYFLAKPQALAAPMRSVMSQYMALASKTGEKPEHAIVDPIAQSLGQLIQMEDDLDESKP